MMFKHIVSILGVVILCSAGASAAEGPQYCVTDDDCAPGFICHYPPFCWDDPCPGVCISTDPGGEGEICEVRRPCMNGLACCYPCGVPDCEYVCTVPCHRGDPCCFNGCYLYP
jgi:hypothetical protein